MSATLRWSVAWIDGGRDVEADLPAWQLAEDDVARLLESKGYQIVGRSRTSKGHEYIAVRETRTMVQVKSQALQPARSERSRRDFGNGGAPNRQVTVYVDTHGPRPWPMLAVPSRWMDDCSRIRTRRYVELGPGRKLSWSGKVSERLVLAACRILGELGVEAWNLAAIVAAGERETPAVLRQMASEDARPPSGR